MQIGTSYATSGHGRPRILFLRWCRHFSGKHNQTQSWQHQTINNSYHNNPRKKEEDTTLGILAKADTDKESSRNIL